MLRYVHALTLFSFISVSFAASADQWQDRSIYQLLTDRFAVRNNAGAPCNTTARTLCGGSWIGITEHLDYIQNMGFDAIWISPVVENIDDKNPYGEAYHGYWTKNISNLNPHFGKPDDLKTLSSAVHARGMYIMVDVVVNHFAGVPFHPEANISSIDDFNLSGLSPFSSPSEFHPFCWIQDYSNQTQTEQCWLGDNNLALIDLDTENPNVVTTMNTWISSLVKDYNIDGIRIDTVRHVRKDFWPDFVKAAGVFSIGEIYDRNVSFVKDYTEVMDSVLDYPTYFALTAAFSSTQGSLSELLDVATASQKSYKRGVFGTGSFLENHDVPRFQSITGDWALVKNAITWSFVTDGIPILYSGQEQGYQGAADPNNREALWLSGYATANKTLVTLVKTLNSARKSAITLNSSFLTTPMTFIPQGGNQAIAISKLPILTLLTNVGQSGTATWNVPGVFEPKQALVDVLTCNQFIVPSNGNMTVSSNDGLPKVLMPSTVADQVCDHGEQDIAKKRRHGNKAPLANKAEWETFGITLFFLFSGWFF
ncbi:glycoside hydrolase family 13 protein [Desarmillaria tabescens]|uniref:alpha-amylase n=1 Tax=Armillaria tabescens TaxID=1929756 RepID=A0AA39JFI4_ARMTA|nr:glycoside hydrolase family 13 protein [Desarmillaria tabescens]KAK0441147.1 glycoside hydrolase family 13 protein [Desarmillaria tabescens]